MWYIRPYANKARGHREGKANTLYSLMQLQQGYRFIQEQLHLSLIPVVKTANNDFSSSDWNISVVIQILPASRWCYSRC